MIIEHLTIRDVLKKSQLENAMEKGICFTTVINSSELFFLAKTEKEYETIKNVLSALKVLGLNSRYSLMVNEYADKVSNVRDAIVCTTAKINKLPILTNNEEKFIKSGLEIINPKNL